MCEGADGGLARRPRLWWTDADLSQAKHFRHGKYDGLPRVFPNVPRVKPDDVRTDGWQWHDDVRSGKKLLPCFTTPAPDDQGRSAPAGSLKRVDNDTGARWEAGGRKFAPWCYAAEAKLQQQGSNGIAFRLPTPEEKEQILHLPRGYTKPGGADARTRHRMLGNTWHASIARALVAVVLATRVLPAVSSSVSGPTAKSIPHISPWGGSRLDAVRLWVGAAQLSYGQPQKDIQMGKVPLLPQLDDPIKFTEQALEMEHPMLRAPVVDPIIEMILRVRIQFGADLARWRHEVIEEVQVRARELAPDTESWLRSLEPHIRQLYGGRGRNKVPMIPLFLELLDVIGYPGREELKRDLQEGFGVIGGMTLDRLGAAGT